MPSDSFSRRDPSAIKPRSTCPHCGEPRQLFAYRRSRYCSDCIDYFRSRSDSKYNRYV